MLYVGGSGPGNYSSIQAAVDDAGDGDTVFVFDDSAPYRETVEVTTSITLMGENRNTTVVDGCQQGSTINISAAGVHVTELNVQNSSGPDFINGSEQSKYYGGVMVTGNHAMVTDLLVTQNEGYGIYLNGSRNVTVAGCRVTENLHHGIKLDETSSSVIANNTINRHDYGKGIDVEASPGNNFTGNTISENRDGGIWLTSSPDNVVAGNVFRSNHHWHAHGLPGLHLEASGGTTVANNTFINDSCYIGVDYDITMENNTVNGKPLVYLNGASHMVYGDDDGEQAGQIITYNCHHLTIQDQHMNNTPIPIHLRYTDSSHLRNNTLRYSVHKGIFLHRSDHNHLAGNSILHTRYGEGIKIESSTGNHVTDNDIYHTIHSGNGIWIVGCTDTTIDNNSFRLSTTGLLLGASQGTIIYNNSIASCDHEGIDISIGMEDLVISHNRITDCRHGVRTSVRGTSIGRRNYTISYNTISECHTPLLKGVGILMLQSKNMTFRGNTISDCDRGLTLWNTPYVKVVDNNFLRITLFKARFDVPSDMRSPHHVWRRNYWGRPRVSPKLITTPLRFLFNAHSFWINIDPLPRMVPYTPPAP